MKQWHELLCKVLTLGTDRSDRTGVGARALFAESIEFENTPYSFPAVTTKKLGFGQCMAELQCFIQGYDSLAAFNGSGCRIWDANYNAPYWDPPFIGSLGRIYGVQWRAWRAVGKDGRTHVTDQLAQLSTKLQTEPHSRRHVVTAWNPGELDQVCLPPCHTGFQCFVDNGHLDMLVQMRSVDLFLGLPFDIASYAVLQQLLAKEAGLTSRRLVFSLGDAHIYNNHLQQVETVLKREPYAPPLLAISSNARLFTFNRDDVALVNYIYHPAIKAEMNV